LDTIASSKTHRLYLLLKERIMTGALVPGERLPGEPALASSHGLSRVTVRRALEGLAREGLIRRAPGAGTFVRSRGAGAAVKGDLTDMLAHLAAMGRDTAVQVLEFGYGEPPPAVALALRLASGERTQHALRVRSADGLPFSLLTTHVPERVGRLFDAEDLAATPMLTLLERSGARAERAEQTVSATLAAPEAAAALQLEIGAPLLSLTRVVFDRQGRGIEHLAALYRPDRHGFHMALSRAGEGADRYWRMNRPAPAKAQTSSRREAARNWRKP